MLCASYVSLCSGFLELFYILTDCNLFYKGSTIFPINVQRDRQRQRINEKIAPSQAVLIMVHTICYSTTIF